MSLINSIPLLPSTPLSLFSTNNSNDFSLPSSLPPIKSIFSTKSTTPRASPSPNHSLHHYSTLIQSCIDSSNFGFGQSIHSVMLQEGIQPDPFLQTKILMLYAREGSVANLSKAQNLFDEMSCRNLTAWNTMILANAKEGNYDEVVGLFLGLMGSGICPDRFTFPSVIKSCVELWCSDGVVQVHGLVIKTGLNRNVVVGGALIDGYVAFGTTDEAVVAFVEIAEKNVVTWNALLRGYHMSSRWNEILVAFDEMQREGLVSPDHFTFSLVIRACGALKFFDQGKQVHAKVISYGYGRDIFVNNTLIDMYDKFEDVRSCLCVFDSMKERNQVSWNAIISAQVHLGCFSAAFMLFQKMHESGFRSDRFTLGSILSLCSILGDVQLGKEVHGHLIRRLLDTNVVLGSALIDMYSKSRYMDMALLAFNRLHERNMFSWNSLICGYVQEGRSEEALWSYRNMILDGFSADEFTLAALIVLSNSEGDLDFVKQIHAQVIRNFSRQNMVLESDLIQMYSECRRLSDAWKIFWGMKEKNMYAWNVMIEGLVQNGQFVEAFQLLYDMYVSGVSPDCYALANCLTACASTFDQRRGKQIHAFVTKNMFVENNVLWCTLIHMYAKCRNIDYAHMIYSNIIVKDVALFNVMISAFLSCSRIDKARDIFDEMKERDTITWNSLLIAYVKGGFHNEALRHFLQMLESDSVFDEGTMVPVLSLCGSVLTFEHEKQLHGFSVKRGLFHRSVVLGTALVDMYAKSGFIEEAKKCFVQMNERNVVAWNAMINACAKYGLTEETFKLYVQMQEEDMKPNDVTFISLLSACSHTGLIEKGLQVFNSMVEDFGIEAKEEHYACIVDLLGRSGRVNEAKEVIDRMPIEPGVSTWGALLGACRMHKNVILGRLASEKISGLEPWDCGHYILMSNIYAESGKWAEAEDVKKSMRSEVGVRDGGYSWIEIGNEVFKFHAGPDQKHLKMGEISNSLKCLTHCMRATEEHESDTPNFVPEICV